MNRVYVITTDLTVESNKELTKNLSEKDQQIMLDLDLKLSVDLVNDEDKITSVIICNQLNLEKMKDFFNNNNVNFTVDDATELFTTEDNNIDELIEEDIIEKMCKDVE
jgi:chemotaxis signal transduction protein